MQAFVELAAIAAAVAVSLWLRPWRMLAGAPPWPWLAWWLLLPILWTADRHGDAALAPALSGAGLALLLAGWPLAVLAFVPAALVALWLGDLGAAETLHRLAWLGVVPATLALGLGALLRRALPRQPFAYLLGRGFVATLVAEAASGAMAALVGAPPDGVARGDLMLARVMVAFGDALICGIVVAVFFAWRPQWLATYADRVWLPPRTEG